MIVPSKGYMFDADTAHYENFSSDNDGYKYVVVFIDILSHYLYTYPLKTLTSKEMVESLNILFTEYKPTIIRTDRGVEFRGLADKYMTQNDVKHIMTSDHSKANYAERVIKTIKMKLTRYMVYKRKHRWVDVLKDVTNSYNNTYHRSIKMTPKEALDTDDPVLWKRQYENKTNPPKKKIKSTIKYVQQKPLFRYKTGDVVRLSKIPGTYDKETDQKWTDELFRVTSRSINQGIQKYEVKDFANDPIIDKFSADELQKVNVSEDTQYDIEKVLKKRKNKGKTQLHIRWKGWGSKFDSWIDENQIEDFT